MRQSLEGKTSSHSTIPKAPARERLKFEDANVYCWGAQSPQISDNTRAVVKSEARPSETKLHPVPNAESEANKSGQER